MMCEPHLAQVACCFSSIAISDIVVIETKTHPGEPLFSGGVFMSCQSFEEETSIQRLSFCLSSLFTSKEVKDTINRVFHHGQKH